MHGSSSGNSAGNYGIKGVASILNEPPSRSSPAYWTDVEGNFWVFGGISNVSQGLNDLWKYDVTTNMWTWISGEKYHLNLSGNYGTKGIPSVNNYPSGRGWSPDFWTDNNGDLWLYGGFQNSKGAFCDLWKYHIATNEWTWINGSNNTQQPYVFGTKGIAAPDNTPGSRRQCSAGWVDEENNLWLFGGEYYSNPTFNDLWKYDISKNEWALMKGDTIPNSIGNYGTKGVEDSNNIPPARWSYSRWKGSDGCFYLFGGGTPDYNDVWKYNPITNNWTWVSGTNQMNDSGTYNAYCAPSLDKYPAARCFNPGISAGNCSSIFWTFGGYYFKIGATRILNDLWNFNPSNNKWTRIYGDFKIGSAAGDYGTMGIASSSNKIPSKLATAMWIDRQNNIWIFGGGNDLWRFTPDSICIQNALNSANINSIADFSLNNKILAMQNPVFTFTNNSINASHFEWYCNGVLFSTLMNPIFTCSDTVIYCFTLLAYSESGCSNSTSHCGRVIPNGHLFIPNAFSPNNDGINDILRITSSNIDLKHFSIYNRWGERLFTTSSFSVGWDGTFKGKPCEIGTYFYLVEYLEVGEKKTTKGDITLIR